MTSSMVCEPFPAPPATPALSAAELDSAAAAAAAAVAAAKAHGNGGGGSGDTVPLPPLGSGALGGSPKLHRGEGGSSGGSSSSSSPLSQSPQRQALPPLPLKQLGRSVSNPVISTTKQRAGGVGGVGRVGGPLRKGKWTPEEEIYAHYIIDNFNKGLISLSRGTTLRSYLSDKLNCDPMRVTKKFSGTSCIGKSVFCPAEPTAQNLELIKVVGRRLEELEHNFKNKIESHPPYGATAAAAQAAQQLQLKQLVQQHGLTGPLTPHPHLSKAHYHSPPPTPSLSPSPLLPPPPPLARSLSASAGSSRLGSGRAAIPPPPPPPQPGAAAPPQLGPTDSSSHQGCGPSPPRPPPTLLPSRHSMPDLVAAAAGAEGGGGFGFGAGANGGGIAERREYRRPAPLVALGNGGGHGLKRGRCCEEDDGALDDHDAGDLLVNFFASVHRTYSSSSLHDMDTTATAATGSEAHADNGGGAPATTIIPRHRALSYPTTPHNNNAASSLAVAAAGPPSASSPASEATFAPEPSPTATLPSPVPPPAPAACKEEAEAEAAVDGAAAAKRAKVEVMEGC